MVAEGELRDNLKLPEFESGSSSLFTEGCDVVLIRVADLFDESVRAESLERAIPGCCCVPAGGDAAFYSVVR